VLTFHVITPLFLFASAAVTISPGPDILFVLSKGITSDRRTAVIAAIGFACGLSIHTTMAVIGLSALLAGSAVAFTVVKLIGAAYLVYLGINALRSGGVMAVPDTTNVASGKKIFGQAFLMNVLNPKVAIFFLAFLPQFTRPQYGNLSAQLLVLGIVFALIALLIFSVVAVFSAAIGGWIRSRPKTVKRLDYLVGSLFIGLGIRLAFSTNK
jgi:threonine/homoserine/homoserine lactone efflux protein